MSQKRPDSSAVTMKTIAEKLGVSVTTVSRSMEDGYKTSPETVARVREMAIRLGYVRNLDGKKLRTGKSLVMMALLGSTREEEVGDSGSVGLLNGIHRRFSATEYSVRTAPVMIGADGLDKVQEIVRGRNADGLILDHTLPQDDRIRFLLEKNHPFVTFGRSDMCSEHAYFDIDNEYAAWQGTTSLASFGYTRIALLEASPEFLFVRQRMPGYARALQDAGLIVEPRLIRHIPLEADIAREEARSLMSEGVDAIVCVNEAVFLGARAGIRQERPELLDTFGFAARTGTNIGEYIGTPIHASHYSRLNAGWNLADILLKLIDGAPVTQCQKVVRTELRIHGNRVQAAAARVEWGSDQ